MGDEHEDYGLSGHRNWLLFNYLYIVYASGANATGHSMFNKLPLVSSDFCAILCTEAVSILACVVQRGVVE